LNFILRFVIILFIFAFIVYVFKMLARLSFRLRGTISDVQKLREQVTGRPVASADMERCSACGAFISSRDAVSISSRNTVRIFCSAECMRSQVAK